MKKSLDTGSQENSLSSDALLDLPRAFIVFELGLGILVFLGTCNLIGGLLYPFHQAYLFHLQETLQGFGVPFAPLPGCYSIGANGWRSVFFCHWFALLPHLVLAGSAFRAARRRVYTNSPRHLPFSGFEIASLILPTLVWTGLLSGISGIVLICPRFFLRIL